MNITQLKEELKRDEGLRLKPYKCTAGKLTIGIGRNLDDRGITEAEAEQLLMNDIMSIMNDLDMGFPSWKALSEVRQRAIINMVFNMGLKRFLGFKLMLNAIRAKDFKKAAEEALNSAWAQQVGERAMRIARMIENG